MYPGLHRVHFAHDWQRLQFSVHPGNVKTTTTQYTHQITCFPCDIWRFKLLQINRSHDTVSTCNKKQPFEISPTKTFYHVSTRETVAWSNYVIIIWTSRTENQCYHLYQLQEPFRKHMRYAQHRVQWRWRPMRRVSAPFNWVIWGLGKINNFEAMTSFLTFTGRTKGQIISFCAPKTSPMASKIMCPLGFG